MINPFPPDCASKFRAERLLARGGFGSVWLATQVGLERLVAVKLLHPDLLVNKHDVRLPKVPVTISPAWRDLEWTMNGVAYTPDTSTALYVFTPPRALEPGDTLTLGFSYTGTEKGASRNGGGAGEFVLPSGVVMTSFSPARRGP